MASLPGKTAPPPAGPATVKVDEGELFEEYQRPDLKEHPRTGKGIRAEPPRAPDPPQGPTAKDILAKLPEPDLQVFTPKRFSPYQVKTSEENKGPHAAEHERAALDAAADLAVHRKWLESATMSTPAAGPFKAVIDHGEGETEPTPLAPAPSPSPIPASLSSIPISPEPSMDTTLPPNAELAAAAPTTMSAAPVIAPTRPVQAPYVPPAAPTVTASRTPHTSGAPAVSSGGDLPRLALVQSDFHYDVTTRMAQAAHEKARMLGGHIAHHVHVPGAFDIPLAAQALLERSDVDAVVCVGAIVQGETGHDQLIARECARLLADLALRLRKPVGFGVTGPGMTREQAWARVGAGATAVESAVKQHRALKHIQA
ncbi:MAG: 6,7-dimethyl-8-ribityllumazine synthase [Thermoplasmatota archaeon]